MEKVHSVIFVAEIQRQIVLKFQIFHINSFQDIIVGIWSSLTFAHKLLVLSILAAKLDFFAYGSFNVSVAEIQRQIVLKFQIFQINTFKDIIVESCRLRRLPASSRVQQGRNHLGPRFYATPHDKS